MESAHLYGYASVSTLIADAERALKGGAYFSALSLTFSLVSFAANVRYPDTWFTDHADHDEYMLRAFPKYFTADGSYKRKKSKGHDKERFVMWYDDWSNDHNCDPALKDDIQVYHRKLEEKRKVGTAEMPELDGELLYQIRCCLFHESSNNVQFFRLSDAGNQHVSDFMFLISPYSLVKTGPMIMKSVSSDTSDYKNYDGSLIIDVQLLVRHLLHLVKQFFRIDLEPVYDFEDRINVIDASGFYLGG